MRQRLPAHEVHRIKQERAKAHVNRLLSDIFDRPDNALARVEFEYHPPKKPAVRSKQRYDKLTRVVSSDSLLTGAAADAAAEVGGGGDERRRGRDSSESRGSRGGRGSKRHSPEGGGGGGGSRELSPVPSWDSQCELLDEEEGGPSTMPAHQGGVRRGVNGRHRLDHVRHRMALLTALHDHGPRHTSKKPRLLLRRSIPGSRRVKVRRRTRKRRTRRWRPAFASVLPLPTPHHQPTPPQHYQV